MYGRINSAWTIQDEGISYQLSIPSNTTAILYLQAADGSNITESGLPAEDTDGVKYIGRQGDREVFQVSSGNYNFLVQQN